MKNIVSPGQKEELPNISGCGLFKIFTSISLELVLQPSKVMASR